MDDTMYVGDATMYVGCRFSPIDLTSAQAAKVYSYKVTPKVAKTLAVNDAVVVEVTRDGVHEHVTAWVATMPTTERNPRATAWVIRKGASDA